MGFWSVYFGIYGGGQAIITPTDQWWRSVAAQAHVAGSVNGDAYVAGPAASQSHLAGSVDGEYA
jgi:hypothetical protein